MIIFLLSILLGTFFEFLMLKFLPKKRLYDSSIKNFSSLKINLEDKVIQEFDSFHKYQKMNQAILAFIIITIVFLILTFFIYIILTCKDAHGNGEIYIFLISILIFIIIKLILSYLILSKVFKIKKKSKGYDLVNDIKKQILKVFILIIVKFSLCCFQIYLYKIDGFQNCRDCCSSSKNNSFSYNYTTKNNVNPTSTSQEKTVISERQYIIKLKTVVSYEIYRNLKLYVEKGKKILEKLIIFYKEMNFIGIRTNKSIEDEITNIIIQLGGFLKYKEDKIINICIDSNEEDAIWLLLVYLFPLIVNLIKLKIEKGIYRREHYVVKINVVSVLTQLERTVESDINGNIRETFRFRQQITQESLVNIIK